MCTGIGEKRFSIKSAAAYPRQYTCGSYAVEEQRVYRKWESGGLGGISESGESSGWVGGVGWFCGVRGAGSWKRTRAQQKGICNAAAITRSIYS